MPKILIFNDVLGGGFVFVGGCRCRGRPDEGARSHGPEIIDSYEPPDMGAGN